MMRAMGKTKTSAPIRTCVACRVRREQRELVRLALGTDGVIVQNKGGKAKGRGAYLCPQSSCWKSPGNQMRLARAFRVEGHLIFHPDLK
jgi:uncharacterized protein